MGGYYSIFYIIPDQQEAPASGPKAGQPRRFACEPAGITWGSAMWATCVGGRACQWRPRLAAAVTLPQGRRATADGGQAVGDQRPPRRQGHGAVRQEGVPAARGDRVAYGVLSQAGGLQLCTPCSSCSKGSWDYFLNI